MIGEVSCCRLHGEVNVGLVFAVYSLPFQCRAITRMAYMDFQFIAVKQDRKPLEAFFQPKVGHAH